MQILKLTKNVDRRVERLAKEVRGIETARAEITANLKREQSLRPELAEAAHAGDAKARQAFNDCDIACVAFQAQLDRGDAVLAEAQGRKNAALAERANAVRGDKIATMKNLCEARDGVVRRIEGDVAKLAASVDEMLDLAGKIEELWKELRLVTPGLDNRQLAPWITHAGIMDRFNLYAFNAGLDRAIGGEMAALAAPITCLAEAEAEVHAILLRETDPEEAPWSGEDDKPSPSGSGETPVAFGSFRASLMGA